MKTNFLLILTLGGWVRAGAVPCVISAKTESGVACGYKTIAANGVDLANFLGLPYAKPPLGKLRFAEPQKPEPFSGFYNATLRRPVCPQTKGCEGIYMDATSMSENCLFINVYGPLASLPNADAAKKPLLPILVFIHGGSFSDGSGDPDSYGPEYLAGKGIILVTFNYRINSIGFLSMNTKQIPGNAALRDGIFALKWVQNNIANFGGDPARVTLGGVSSGAIIAHLISISPAVEDLELFKRVIIMSGTGVSDFLSTSPLYAKLISTVFLEGMGINLLLPPKEIYRELINATTEKIMEATEFVQKTLSTRMTFAPVIETPRPGVTPILPKSPEQLMDEGYGADKPLLMSFVNNECAAYKNSLNKVIPLMKSFPIASIPFNLLFTSNPFTLPALAQKIASKYFQNTTPTIEKYLQFCSEAFYKLPSLRVLEKRVNLNAAPTYMSEFGYEGKQFKNCLKIDAGLNWTGAGHTEDFSYLFRVNTLWEPVEGDELSRKESDFRMIDWMTDLYTNFVKTGRPTTDPSKWPPSGRQYQYLRILKPFVYKYGPAPHALTAKKQFYYEMRKPGGI